MTIKARGTSAQQRVIWMATFAPGVNGRRGLPYVLVGPPGGAKTSQLSQLAQTANLPFESVLGSLRSPVDFLGVPVPQRRQLCAADQHLAPDGDEELLYMHYAPSGFALRAALAKRAVVLFDEANTMPPSVQAAMLRVLFEGVVGELQLPPGVRFFLAMNATEDAAGGWDIAPPMANRMGWIDWSAPSVEDWVTYMQGGAVIEPIDPTVEEKAVDAAWPKAFAQALGYVAGFLKRRGGELFHAVPKGSDKSKPWPSPRTWEFATRALAGSAVYGFGEDEEGLATAAFVGSGAYSEFKIWRREADLPDPEKLLDKLETFEHKPARLDRTAAVLAACTAIVTAKGASAHKDHSDRVSNLWELMHGMGKDAVDVMSPSVVALNKARLMMGTRDQIAYKVMGDMEPVLTAAGIARLA